MARRSANLALGINATSLAGSTRVLSGTSKSFRWKESFTVLPQDTFGISKILSDYTVETTFQKLGDCSTKMQISHFYSTTSLKAKLLNVIAKGRIARETRTTLVAIKAPVEANKTC